jgi:hypothetical protein
LFHRGGSERATFKRMPCDRFIEVVGVPVWRSIPVTNRRLCPEKRAGIEPQARRVGLHD